MIKRYLEWLDLSGFFEPIYKASNRIRLWA